MINFQRDCYYPSLFISTKCENKGKILAEAIAKDLSEKLSINVEVSKATKNTLCDSSNGFNPTGDFAKYLLSAPEIPDFHAYVRCMGEDERFLQVVIRNNIKGLDVNKLLQEYASIKND